MAEAHGSTRYEVKSLRVTDVVERLRDGPAGHVVDHVDGGHPPTDAQDGRLDVRGIYASMIQLTTPTPNQMHTMISRMVIAVPANGRR